MKPRGAARLAAAIRCLLPASAAAVCCLLPASAQAASSSFLSLFGPPGTSIRVVDGTITGSLSISFHGDGPAGCAAHGVCAYSGTTQWLPQGLDAGLVLLSSRTNGRLDRSAELLPLGGGSGSAQLTALTRRALPGGGTGTCGDASASGSSVGTQLPWGNGLVAVRALGGGSTTLANRCAGPRDTDIASALPSVSVRASVLARGHRTIDLAGNRDFAAGGFAGTVHSTLALHLGAPESQSPGSSLPVATRRVRYVSVPLRVTAAAGMLAARFAGVGEPNACVVLDSCAATGTTTLMPALAGASGELFAVGPARRPLRDFLTALGLRRGGQARGIDTGGSVSPGNGLTPPPGGGGTAATVFTQDGQQCRDEQPLGPSLLALSRTRHGFHVTLSAGPLSARCPGPQLFSLALAQTQEVASGGLALGGPGGPGGSARGRFAVTLRADRASDDDGYTVATSGALTLTLERGPVRTRVFRQPGL